MTIDLPPRTTYRPPLPEAAVQAAYEELVIKEARRRRRRRLLVNGGIAVAVIAGAVIAVVALVSQGVSSKQSSARPTLSTRPLQPTAIRSCRTSQLKVSSLSGLIGAGSVDMIFEFVNTSRSVCTLSGYPRVVPVDKQGVEMNPASPVTGSQATSSFYNGQPPLRIDLKPGEAASSAIQGDEHPVGTATSCPSYPSFLVTPPNQSRSVMIWATAPDLPPGVRDGSGRAAFPGCIPIAVNPIVPGTSGAYPQKPLPISIHQTPMVSLTTFVLRTR
jgi:hypothetical protein